MADPSDPSTTTDESSSSFFDCISEEITATPTSKCAHEQPSNELFDMVTNKRWHFAEKHLERHAADARFRHPVSHETVVSMACRHKPPARFIKKLLQAFPQAATLAAKDEHGCIPLHHACRQNASLDVLKELLAAHPETAAIMSIAASIGTTPIAALWEGRNTTETTGNCSTIFWQKMELLLRSIAKARGDDESLVLHAVASLGIRDTPKEVWDYVLRLHAHQARVVDHTGRLPLHYAAMSTVDNECSEASLADKYKPRQEQVLYRLLQLYPDAASIKDPNESGRWVLHTAIMHGHVWHGGIKELFEAAPEATLFPDPRSGLMPCQLSQDLNTIYRLVRAHPSVMEAQIKAASRSLTRHKSHDAAGIPVRPRNRDKENMMERFSKSLPNLAQSRTVARVDSQDERDQSLPFEFEKETPDAETIKSPALSPEPSPASTSKASPMTLGKFMAKEKSKQKKKTKQKKRLKRVTDDDVSLHREFFATREAQNITGLFYGSLRNGPTQRRDPS